MTPNAKAGAKTGNPHVVARSALQKSVRAAIGLRYRLEADAELAERFPAILEKFDASERLPSTVYRD
jgi:hypothetical protein